MKSESDTALYFTMAIMIVLGVIYTLLKYGGVE